MPVMSMLVKMKPRDALQELMEKRILLLDGSMGALIYSKKPQEPDYRGERFRVHPVSLMNCTEALVLTQPQMIEDIHRAYLEAGSDIVETCTFNGNRLSLEEFQLSDLVVEINKKVWASIEQAAENERKNNR